MSVHTSSGSSPSACRDSEDRAAAAAAPSGPGTKSNFFTYLCVCVCVCVCVWERERDLRQRENQLFHTFCPPVQILILDLFLFRSGSVLDQFLQAISHQTSVCLRFDCRSRPSDLWPLTCCLLVQELKPHTHRPDVQLPYPTALLLLVWPVWQKSCIEHTASSCCQLHSSVYVLRLREMQ